MDAVELGALASLADVERLLYREGTLERHGSLLVLEASEEAHCHRSRTSTMLAASTRQVG